MARPIGSPGPRYAPPETTDPVTGLAVAPWGRRVGAAVLDALVVIVPMTAVSVPLLVFWALRPLLDKMIQDDCFTTTCHLDPASFYGRVLLVNLVAGLVPALYLTLMEGSRRGQTIGMMAAQVAVVSAVDAGPIGRGRAGRRFLVRWLFGAFPPALLLDVLSPLWDPRRRAWHDHAAGSIVVERPRS